MLDCQFILVFFFIAGDQQLTNPSFEDVFLLMMVVTLVTMEIRVLT